MIPAKEMSAEGTCASSRPGSQRPPALYRFFFLSLSVANLEALVAFHRMASKVWRNIMKITTQSAVVG